MLSGIIEREDTYYGETKKGSKRGGGTGEAKVIVAVSKNENGRPRYTKMKVVGNIKGVTVGQFAKEDIKKARSSRVMRTVAIVNRSLIDIFTNMMVLMPTKNC